MATKNGRWWLTEDSDQMVIGTTPERIYDLVADMPRMGEWSPECQRVEWEDGPTGPAEGATFVGHNRGGPAGLMKWSRRGRVLVADPGREFAFVTEEGGRESTEWRYRFEACGRGHPGHRVLRGQVDTGVGPHRRRPHQPRTASSQESMRHTLGQLKKAAEAKDEVDQR